MSRLRVSSIAVSLDGFSAGPSQSLEEPLGVGGERLHEWMYSTRFFHQMTGQPGGSEGIDNDFLDRGFEGIGAWILGRNMFGPVRADWPDDEWQGWWGDTPPYHCPVFVLTHYARPSIEMNGGTTFHFVTEGIEVALERAQHRRRRVHARLQLRTLRGRGALRRAELRGLRREPRPVRAECRRLRGGRAGRGHRGRGEAGECATTAPHRRDRRDEDHRHHPSTSDVAHHMLPSSSPPSTSLDGASRRVVVTVVCLSERNRARFVRYGYDVPRHTSIALMRQARSGGVRCS